MRHATLGTRQIGAAAMVLLAFGPAAGQTLERGQVVPIDLVRPTYPPIAAAARVTGDVTVVVRVLADGSIAGAELVSGPPLLSEPSVSAARASRFECRACDGERSHTITYSFKFDAPDAPPEIDQSGSRVHVTTQSPVVIINFSSLSVRSVRCLYLWRCGSEWGGMTFYNDKVRSARCAWLWKCGWRPRERS